MDNLKIMAQAFLQGFYDSVKGVVLVFSIDNQMSKLHESKLLNDDQSKRLVDKNLTTSKIDKKTEPKIMKQFWKCCILNGGFAWVGILFFEYVVLRLLKYILTFSMDEKTEEAQTIWIWLSSTLSILFGMTYVLPIFLLSKIVSSLWFQDIADSAYKFRKGRPQLIPGISKMIADTIFSLLVQMLFLIQSMIVSLMPIHYIGNTLCYIHLGMLYALYSFEYKWVNMGWELHKRLSFIECNWIYFIGFGMPLTILTNLSSSYIVSGCIFSIAFPIFILSANEAQPVTGSCDFPLRLFSPVVAISNCLLKTQLRSSKQIPLTTAAINEHNQRIASDHDITPERKIHRKR